MQKEDVIAYLNKIIIGFLAFYYAIKKAWLCDDAFITLRHVRNFLSGYGPVFNPGERVEGFTHALWFYIVSLFKFIGLSYKGAAVLPGLIFTLIFIYLALFKVKFGESSSRLSYGIAILLGTSAFIDFATSGLETSLSYLLLGIYSYIIAEKKYIKSPLFLGIINGLLYLNRPDFGVFLILSMVYVYLKAGGRDGLMRSWKVFLGFFLSAGPYQLFRMGYYGALFPNPFYAKSGSSSYWSHGLLYLKDFLEGSLYGVLIVLVFVVLLISYRRRDSFSERLFLSVSGFVHGFFVVRGGGDFMHGRFLLPSMILFSLSINGFEIKIEKNKVLEIIASILIFNSLFFSSLFIFKPLQIKRKKPIINGISDERFFYYRGKLSPFRNLLKDDIRAPFKHIGLKYRRLAKQLKMKIRITAATSGKLGFYSGPKVYVLDIFGLSDPVISRIEIKRRKRPGHEKWAPFPYVFHKGLTFGRTPFPLWNRIAKTEYGVLWDLREKSIKKMERVFLREGFKEKIDSEIKSFLKGCGKHCVSENADFLLFLKKYWVKYADGEGKNLFFKVYRVKEVESFSSISKWLSLNKNKIKIIEATYKGKVNSKKFLKNILFSIFKSNFIKISVE